MRTHILSEIERRRAELATLDQRRLIITSELSLLDELLQHVPRADTPPRRGRAAGASSTSGPRGLSKRWMPVLVDAVNRYPRSIRGDEVAAIQTAAGQEPAGTNNIRSHFWMNAKPGKFYERVAANEYRATEIGAALVGMPLGGQQNSNGASHEPAPSQNFENRGEPQSSSDARSDLLNPNKAAMPGGGT